MRELNRSQVGEFNIKDTITLEKLEALIKDKVTLEKSYFITIENMFIENPSINISESELKKYLNGVKIPVKLEGSSNVCKVYSQNNFIGIGIIEGNALKRDLVINEHKI